MKKRNFFAATLIGLALVACSSVEDINGGTDQNNEGAVVTLKLDMSNTPLTKGSPGATNQQVGTAAENTISNVTVVVDYGSNTRKVFKKGDTGVTWTEDNKTLEFKTPAGDATFYVYANVNDNDVNNLSTSWAENLVSNGTESNYYQSDNFFMSNQNGKGIKHTINEDTENNITVNIERAAAKVTVESPADFTSTYGGTLSDMKFALGNKISKFYLLQQSNIASPTNDVEYLPSNNQTGNWKNVSLGKTSATGENHQDLSAFAADYCMENVHPTYTQDITTYIKFQTTFTPANVLDFQTSTEGDWTVKADLKPVDAPTEIENAPSFFVVLDGDANYTSNYILKSDLYQTDGTTPKDGLTIEPTTDGYTVEGITGITKISKEYVNGKCYFGPIWINIDQTGNTSPIYRNDWYHLKVTDIKLPGLPSEPGDGGKIPLTPDVNVTVTLDVLDWELEERNIVLQ